MPFRFSKRPQKQFLWILIRRDSKLSKGLDVGLDAGCADMRNRKFFQTKSYIGIDVDGGMLSKGKLKNPDARTLKCNIIDIPDEISADFIHCVQVFVNSDFVNEEAVRSTRKLVSLVRSGGTLLMNTGKQTIKYDSEIKRILDGAFEEVIQIKYGNIGLKSLPVPLSLLAAFIMRFFPAVRTLGGHSKTYFCCVGRK
jgi:trans-aconitate methyltransferase